MSKPLQQTVTLAYNEDGFSFDTKRNDGNLTGNLTIPAELIPEDVVSEDIIFRMGNKSENQKNILSAGGQKIALPKGNYNKLYILAAATKDTQGAFRIGNKTTNLPVQSWTGFIGQHYGRVLYFNNMKVASINNAFTKRDNIAWFASHRHTPEANDTYQYSYIYKYEITLPEGARSVQLPDNPDIKLFAMTVANVQKDDITPLQPLYDDFSGNLPVRLRVNEIITADLKPLATGQKPLFTENVDERMLPRLKQYLRSAGMDTVIAVTPPSASDYADAGAGNKVTATYYPVGKSIKGIEYSGQKFDISNILDSKSGVLKDTLFFDNGEGRIVINLQRTISVDRINIFFETFRGRSPQSGAPGDISRNRGQQIFSIWASPAESDVTGDPKTKGWQYIGAYGGAGGRGFGGSGASYMFKNNLKCKYLMFISDGSWHGSDYIKQLDVFEAK